MPKSRMRLAIRSDHNVRGLNQAVENIVVVRGVHPLGHLNADASRLIGRQTTFLTHESFEGLAFDHRPGEIVQATGGADIDEGHNSGVRELTERTHLSAGESDVPHTTAWQYLHGILIVVVLRAGTEDLPHAALANRIEQDVRPEDQALRFLIQDALGLKRGKRSLSY